ncbi:MAG TPA: hypothetical protein VGL94_00505 [Ktedonobacteraceae bacterium]
MATAPAAATAPATTVPACAMALVALVPITLGTASTAPRLLMVQLELDGPWKSWDD